MKKILLFPLFLFIIGCSYKCQLPDELSSKSINVPYVVGDIDGQLTEALVYQLSATGMFEYKHSDADYKLFVTVNNIANDSIGFKKDREENGCVQKNLITIEGREKIFAEVFLASTLTGETLWGPKVIIADVDYDYVDQNSFKDLTFKDSMGERHPILPFSLGQLESTPCAQEAALRPLYASLAKNIVNAIIGELGEEDY